MALNELWKNLSIYNMYIYIFVYKFIFSAS